MLKSLSKAFLVVLVLGLAGGSKCYSEAQSLAAIKVLHLSNSLEMAYDHPGTSSDLTFQDLMAAYEEFSSWDQESMEHLRASVPFIRLVADFCLLPMKRIFAKDKSRFSDPMVQQQFIERLEEFYERFRPIYYSETQSEPSESFNSPQTDRLIEALMDTSEQPLTRDLVGAAWEEYRQIEAKIDEIALHENIYEKADEYEQLLNYLNRLDVNAVYEAVFPYIDQLNTEEERLAVKKFYSEALQMRLAVLSAELQYD